MSVVRTEMRRMWSGRPGKWRRTKRAAYLDVAWARIFRDCDCEEGDASGCGRDHYHTCGIHRDLRDDVRGVRLRVVANRLASMLEHWDRGAAKRAMGT